MKGTLETRVRARLFIGRQKEHPREVEDRVVRAAHRVGVLLKDALDLEIPVRRGYLEVVAAAESGQLAELWARRSNEPLPAEELARALARDPTLRLARGRNAQRAGDRVRVIAPFKRSWARSSFKARTRACSSPHARLRRSAPADRSFARSCLVPMTRDVLGSAAVALVPLPAKLADVQALTNRLVAEEGSVEATDLLYRAWRWLGERAPWMSYLTATPRFAFVRLVAPDRLRVGFDNRECLIDGVAAWTATHGHRDFAPATFESNLRNLADRLLAEMADRLDRVAEGKSTCQAPVDLVALRAQHQTWATELRGYLSPRAADVAWSDTLAALRGLATRYDLDLDV